MKNIAIIGCGQVGSRHLQSLAKLSKPTNIYIIDHNKESRAVSQGRLREIEGHEKHKVAFSHEPSDLPKKLDIVIIATNANQRLKAMQGAIANSTISYMILEKIMFSTKSDIEEAKSLLEVNNIKAWVNCSKRYFNFMDQITEQAKQSKLIGFEVQGNNWGLACNAIHFLDLISFTCQKHNYSISAGSLSPEIFESKRKKYFEIFGQLTGSFDETVFKLACTQDNNSPLSFNYTFIFDDKSITIDEMKKTMSTSTDGNEQHSTFAPIYQSDLTHKVCNEILNTSSCKLATFDESAKLHLPLIDCLSSFWQDNSEYSEGQLPIT